ncbi:AAA family ATPase [Streptomyces sp. NBC_00879]|uniref:ATP-binding protein n=1 Tax=Streptomyces sp. NBC_00879 TaxID=2975855 RepID=UPI00386A72F6|nr:AAA family ATPase [Streptomyces sp. NBC_00879]
MVMGRIEGGGRRAGFAFVGRGDELRLLRDALSSGPAVVFVEGEAGVGKSRLVGEALARLAEDGTPVLLGWCHPLREPLPFGPVIDALREGHRYLVPEVKLTSAVWALRALLPEFTDRFPTPAPDGTEAVGGTPDLMRAVHEVLSALGPVVVVVEDVHWADEATRELLLLLARNPPQGLRLVVTYRAQDLPVGHAVLGSPYRRPVGVGGVEISLPPLSEAQVRELADSVLGPQAALALGRQLFERSGGLPLAAEEDLLALADLIAQPNSRVPSSLEGMGVPRALQEVVSTRVAALDPVAVAVVEAAAVLAVPAPEEVLAVLAKLDEEEMEEGVTAALQASVLIEASPGMYGFRHVLARRAVYGRIFGPRRRRLHLRAVEALEGQKPPSLVQIAHHTRQLGDVQAWLPRALAAAGHAVEVGDDGVAADLLQQLLSEPALPPEQRTRCALALSRIAMRRIDQTASLAALRAIVADPALAVATRGEIRLNLGQSLLIKSPRAEGDREIVQAIGELESRPDLAAVAMATLGIGMRDVSISEDIEWMHRAVDTVASTDDPVARATVLACRITLLETMGDPLGRELLEQLPRESSDPEVVRQCARAVHNAADEGYWRGDDDRARALLDEAETLTSLTRNERIAASCGIIRLELDFAAGRWTGLDDRIETIAPESGQREGVFQVEPMLIRVQLAIARGQWPRARERLGHLTKTPGWPHWPPWLMLWAAALGRLELAEGNMQAAWDGVQPALEALRRKNNWVWMTDLVPTAVQAALACGLPSEAERLVGQVERGIDGRNAPGAVAELLLCRGLLAVQTAPARGVENLEQAQARFNAIGRLHRAARVTEQIGKALLTAAPQSPGVAARRLQEAADVFTELGATADEARCRQALREIGQERPLPRGRRSYGDGLSPREEQVAQLLAIGATNYDIARALSLSVRTVEHHVARTLRKLRITREQIRSPHT